VSRCVIHCSSAWGVARPRNPGAPQPRRSRRPPQPARSLVEARPGIVATRWTETAWLRWYAPSVHETGFALAAATPTARAPRASNPRWQIRHDFPSCLLRGVDREARTDGAPRL